MLEVDVPQIRLFDDVKNEFITLAGRKLQLEHSLVSLSKWETKWHKPFLGTEEKSKEETYDYVRCMTLTQNVNSLLYQYLPDDVIQKVYEYVADPMTATWFRENGRGGGRQIVTNELIYYWMISYQIPFECQKWHLNRLMTLIRVCQEKNTPAKKLSRSELLRRQSEINAARRAKLHSKG